MVSILHRVTRDVIVERGWESGTDLEDRVALHLSRCGWSPARQSAAFASSARRNRKIRYCYVHQQYRLLNYRLDFAWPEVKICLEADGWYHRNLDVLDRDRKRDADLRNIGWWTFRVDWTAGEDVMYEQISRVSSLVHLLIKAGDLELGY